MTTPPNEPPQNPPPEPTNPPPEPNNPPPPPSNPAPPDPSHGGSERLGALEKVVETLVETVTKLIPSDERPVKKPWTHWGSK